MRTKAILLGAALVAGCNATTTPGPQLTTLEAAQADLDRLDALADTSAADMRTSGMASFSGKALGEMTDLTSGASVIYWGDAALDVAFASVGGTISGAVTGFQGSVSSGHTGSASGSLDLYSGTISGASADLAYSGALSLEGQELTMAGTLQGGFRGASGDAILLNDSSGSATIDGTSVLNDLTLFAERE